MKNFEKNNHIKINFKLDKKRFLIDNDVKIVFSNENKYDIKKIDNNSFSVEVLLEDYLYKNFDVAVGAQRIGKDNFLIKTNCNIFIDPIDVTFQGFLISPINKSSYQLDGLVFGKGINTEDTIKIKVNNVNYRTSLLQGGYFSVNIMLRDLLLDNTLLITSFDEKGEISCQKEFSYEIKKSKQRNFSYYFSQDIKRAIRAEVFLFKNAYIKELKDIKQTKLLNFFHYRNTFDGNISYIIAFYLNAYSDNVQEFIELLYKITGIDTKAVITTQEMKIIVDTKRRIQDNIKMDIDLWNRLEKFLKDIREYSGINYTKHTIVDLFFADYYQVYKKDIEGSLVHLYKDIFYNSAILTKRDENNKINSIAEKMPYILNEKEK